MDFYAHITEDGRRQTVEEHLENTGKLCAKFATAFGDEPQGELIGKVHDIGKCSSSFQERLMGGRIVDHASAGALECAKKNAIWASVCIAGHHGGLPDMGNLKNDTYEDATLTGRLKKAISGKIPRYDVPVKIPDVSPPNHYGKDYLNDSFVIRMLYSCLVDADYLDTESFMSDNKVERGGGEALDMLLDKLTRYVEPWWNYSNDLNRRRCEILKACINGSAQDKGLYTLTVPTGGGKTVASVAFALEHAVKHKMDRVVYVIPYTSIIEQTASVFRGIFGESNVVEHHSNASYEVRNDGDLTQYRLAKATENWDAPIIVTTAVQFFESMYSNRPSKCRKLHNLANSVIVFDEAQMLPAEHLRPCVAAIAMLVKCFCSTAVLCTATQPSLNDLFYEFAPGCSIKELCPNPSGLFEEFRRVRFENIGMIETDVLASRLEEQEQVLCIVNSRKSAQEVYNKLSAEGSYHLSTLMYPRHRQAVLEEIRSRLKEGKTCRVVSTSLIEAGVDVDFPTVYREMAGLDSILQAAGRCNREGRRMPDESVVTVFIGVSVTPALLKVNIGATNEVLIQGIDLGSFEAVERYFKSFRSLRYSDADSEDPLDKNMIVRSFERGIQGCMLPFRSVAEKFRLINDNTRTVYIPLEEGERLVQRLKAGEHSRDLFRKLGRYSVNVYDNHFEALLTGGKLETIDENSAILMDITAYDNNVGLSVNVNSGNAMFA